MNEIRIMDINNLNKRLENFTKARDWDKYHSPKNLAMALTGEVGELNEIFQWLTEEESYTLDKKVMQEAKEEVADITIYLLKICTKLNINLEAAVLEKIKINEEKYPIEKIRGNFKKYTEL